ncbi:MAG: hypothetical protein HON90_13475, partial [Halobacteriovoraceae bacterium]|nr:hypothetical protein [Halobacteriovoraceae bacterium]
PEGLAKTSKNELLVAYSILAEVWKVDINRKSKRYISMAELPGWEQEMAIFGIAIDSKDRVYIAAPEYRGGSLIRYTPNAMNKFQVLVTDANAVNSILVDEELDVIFIASMDTVQRYQLSYFENPYQPIVFNSNEHAIVTGMTLANGISFNSDKSSLIVADTMNYGIYKIDSDIKPEEKITDLSPYQFSPFEGAWSWPDGIVYLKKYKLFAVADNFGSITFIDEAGNQVLQYQLLGDEGVLSAASLTVINDKLIISDLWEPGYFNVLKSVVKSRFTVPHHSIYSLRLDKVLKGY